MAAAGGDVEAEQVGDRPGADQGRPVAAHDGIVGGVPEAAVVRSQAGVDVGAGDSRGAEGDDLRRPRSRRGCHGNGRTGVPVEGFGGCGGHGA